MRMNENKNCNILCRENRFVTALILESCKIQEEHKKSLGCIVCSLNARVDDVTRSCQFTGERDVNNSQAGK